ncbi:hypothetical protein WJX84_008512 [Apatococcus fuscideae]|uniref:Magnesium-protoporphyrin IX methyltransferase C-terminal domain-containing protein n=1 Tax=Apatococcus fuscideae TaxID=2026836 RepID=A0AAW1TCL7_9CHLO
MLPGEDCCMVQLLAQTILAPESALVDAAVRASPAAAADLVTQVADAGSLPLALGGGAAVAALSVALIATDPDKRRQKQTKTAGGNEMDAVRNYFNTEGFGRWQKIYGDKDDVSKVQMDIREGHAETVAKVLRMIDADSGIKGKSCCDVGCGTGSLSLPLAQRGAVLTASDISDAMVGETKRKWQQLAVTSSTQPDAVAQPTFEAKDLESVTGSFHTVCCLDVLIHYPQEKADGMIKHLAGLSEKRLILSFAPKTLQYSILKRIGELFPGPSKATRAYLHAEADVEAALQQAGFRVTKKEMTATSFYFSRLFQAERI